MILPSTESQDFHVFAGDDFDLVFTVTDESGASITLTGMTFEWRLVGLDSTTKVFKTSAGGSISASGSTVTVSGAAADTVNLVGNYQHQLRGIDSLGKNQVMAYGRLTVGQKFTGTL